MLDDLLHRVLQLPFYLDGIWRVSGGASCDMWSQQGHVEDWMDPREPTSQVQLVRQLTYPLQYTKRSNPALLELPRTGKIQVAAGQQHGITHTKLLVAVARVIIPLLPRLSPTYARLRRRYKSSNTLRQFGGGVIADRRAYHDVNWQRNPGPKDQLTRGKTRGLLHTRVNRHLNLRQQLTPLTRPDLPVRQQASHHLLQGPMSPLGLPISLRMIAAGKQRLGPEQTPKLSPKRTRKSRVSVVEHLARYPKHRHHVREKVLRDRASRQLPRPKSDRHQADKLGETVHTSHNPREPVPTSW